MEGMYMEQKKLKICFAASSGGHLEEISQLKELLKYYDGFLITEKDGLSKQFFCYKLYFVRQKTRKEKLFLIYLFLIFLKDIILFLKEKPDCIISTGALTTFPACFLGKIMGKKVIYIESFARVNSASLTGRLVYRFADMFLVQWKETLKFYPKAIYIQGGLF